ncbi:UDP-galactopyranose mutase [Desulfobacterales bacterium HSG17]|nr:UDP-galactopyranose mutase [Desulfobacterales bacterium HSG17]
MKKVDVLVVGAGITGITVASILAREKNKKVLVVEQRDHIGGNCYDCYNDDGILIHKYGPHIFHTVHKDVWDYLSNFTDWIPYVHHVKAFVDNKYISFPININTFEQLFERPFTKDDVLYFLEQEKQNFPEIRNAEEMVLSRMGKTIYEKFFKNYTKKQWGMDAKDLAPEITARIPIRLDRDERFFTDPFQGIPSKGYTAMFNAMLDHENIQVITRTTYKIIKKDIYFDRLFYTGPIDEFFDYKYGRLPYRGINFFFKTLAKKKALPAAVVNYPNENDYTRITEFKHFNLQVTPKTTLCYEFPADVTGLNNDIVPAYPVLNSNSFQIYQLYKQKIQAYLKI